MKKILILTILALSIGMLFAGCASEPDTAYNTAVKYDYKTEDGKSQTILIHLEFEGGKSSSSSLTVVSYGEKISGLPLDLSKEGYDFSGWYTEPNCGGYQIADKEGFIKNRHMLNESILNVTDQTESITLYAGWIESKKQVSLHLGNKTYKIEVSQGEFLDEIELEDNLVAFKYSINPSGFPLYDDPINKDIDLYVISYKKIYNNGKTISCVDNNGYDTSVSGSPDNEQLHKGWQMGQLELQSNKNGDKTEYTLSYRLKQDIYHLPMGAVSGNLNQCWLNNDSFQGKVVGTDLQNKRIGFGACYVEIIYQNGFKEKFSETNFLAGSYKNEAIEIASFSGNVKAINVSVVYELSFNNKISFWLGCTWSANYRFDCKILP